MLKSTYDTDMSGVVDNAEKVDGVDAATASQYYGKNSGGFNWVSRFTGGRWCW